MFAERFNESFENRGEFDSGTTHSYLRFVGCTFQNCVVALTKPDLNLRTRFTNIEFMRCGEDRCRFVAPILEDILIDNLKTSDLIQVWGGVFKHVTLRGNIDRLMLSPLFNPRYPDSDFQKTLDNANSTYYGKLDWALDIRDARFKDFDCRGVPSRLIRRDAETQVMVTREKVLASGSAIEAGGQFWHSWLTQFLADQYPDEILAAPRRDTRFKELVAGLNELRRLGVTEPD